MSGRIVEISERPILCKFDKEQIKDPYIHYIAEYMYEPKEEYSEAISHFLNQFKDIILYNKEKNTVIFRYEAKEEFFKKQYELFVSKVSNMTLTQFADPDFMFNINDIIVSNYNDYFIFNEAGYSVNTFMREMKPGVEYYLGGIICYHN